MGSNLCDQVRVANASGFRGYPPDFTVACLERLCAGRLGVHPHPAVPSLPVPSIALQPRSIPPLAARQTLHLPHTGLSRRRLGLCRVRYRSIPERLLASQVPEVDVAAVPAIALQGQMGVRRTRKAGEGASPRTKKQ